jgi:NTP pyrophosphatase (non-canonical NTP hydrolase)
MNDFQALNETRCRRWHALESWDINDWIVALGGEVGEAQNIVKKMNRIRDNIKGNPDEKDIHELREKLLDELSDAYIYLDLVFTYLGANKERRIAKKFNQTSEKYGFPERMEIPI